MLRSLLVGIHGSQGSDAACEIGMTWAASLNISLTCLGVVDVSGLAPAAPYLPGCRQIKVVCDTDEIDRRRERIQTALRAATQRAAQAGVECHLLNRDGSPAVLLGLKAQRHDLLILERRKNPATDNDSPASETLMEILRHAPRPIVVACQNIPKTSNVVIAYDGSVQDAQGQLVGLISLDDVLQSLAGEFRGIERLLQQESPETLASIRTPEKVCL